MKIKPHLLLSSASSTFALALAMSATSATAAVDYITAGGTYSQDFDSLGTSGGAWANDDTLEGWHWVRSTPTPATPTDYIATNGDSGTDQILNFGNDPDRAFGSQNGDASQDIYFGLQLTNNTDSFLDSFTLTYTGEQWRAIKNEGADQLSFSYQIFDSGEGSLTAETPWSDVADLDFIAPITRGGNASTGFDGNLDANREEGISATISGIAWGEGQELWLRWNDNNPGSSDYKRAAMGIDDLSFTAAVPEPSAAALLFGGIGALLIGLRRRR